MTALTMGMGVATRDRGGTEPYHRFCITRSFPHRAKPWLALVFLAATACAGPGKQDPTLVGDIAGMLRTTQSRQEDIVFDIARKNRLGILEVVAANPALDPWLPGRGTEILLPTAHILPDGPRDGIVVNVAELRLYYFRESRLVMTAPIGIGREGYRTPLGVTKIVKKQKDPTWYPTASTRKDNPELPRAVGPGPDNPLGAHALRLGWPTYLLHGTNTPDGVGQRASRGCIRLYPEDIARLHDIVPVGTVVRVIDQPVKIGRRAGELFLEAHPEKKQFDDLALARRNVAMSSKRDEAWVKRKAGPDAAALDWPVIRHALRARAGVPVQITRVESHPVAIAETSGGLKTLFARD